MSAATVARLHKHSNIVAIKEATGIPDMTSEIMSLCKITVLKRRRFIDAAADGNRR